MRRICLLAVPILAALAVAPSAFGSGAAHVTTVELRSQGAHSFGTPASVARFTLAGVSWRGSGKVLFRTRATGGRWSAWRPGAPEDEDGPDVGSPERRLPGLEEGQSVVGRDVERHPGSRSGTRDARSCAPRVEPGDSHSRSGCPRRRWRPPIVPRLSWGADESIRRGPPSYAADVRFAIVHHTAGRNDYTRAEAPAIVKGIQLFHVQGNGWNDIGYNFLVDRFGTIYEGRFGGVDRNVIGAHALGFNTESVGIALLGTYGNTPRRPRPRTPSLDSSPGGSISPTSIRRPSSRTSRAAASATRAGSRFS